MREEYGVDVKLTFLFSLGSHPKVEYEEAIAKPCVDRSHSSPQICDFPIRSINSSPFENYASLTKADLSRDCKEL